MLNEDLRIELDYVYSRVVYANEQLQQLKHDENFKTFKQELITAKATFESVSDIGQGDEWFDKRLAALRDTLNEVNEISSNSKDRLDENAELKTKVKVKLITENRDLIRTEQGIVKSTVPTYLNPSKKHVDGSWIDEYTKQECSLSKGPFGVRNYWCYDFVCETFLKKYKRLPIDGYIINSEEEAIQILNSGGCSSAVEVRIQERKENEEFDNIERNFIGETPLWIKFSPSDFINFSGKDMNLRDVEVLFTNTCTAWFKISAQILQGWDEKKKAYRRYEMTKFHNLFNLGYIDDKAKINNSRTYYIFFDTPLSKFIVHNLLSGAIMFIDKETYNYSDLEQILLRHYVLGNTIRVIKPSVEECINNLAMRDSNITNATNRIYDAWKALKEKGYIDTVEKKVREKEWRKKKIYEDYFEVTKTGGKNGKK